jgi:hypothetical protein
MDRTPWSGRPPSCRAACRRSGSRAVIRKRRPQAAGLRSVTLRPAPRRRNQNVFRRDAPSDRRGPAVRRLPAAAPYRPLASPSPKPACNSRRGIAAPSGRQRWPTAARARTFAATVAAARDRAAAAASASSGWATIGSAPSPEHPRSPPEAARPGAQNWPAIAPRDTPPMPQAARSQRVRHTARSLTADCRLLTVFSLCS